MPKKVIGAYVLLMLWTVLACASVGFNLYKGITTEKHWLFMSDQEKRYMLFGDLYTFFICMNAYTPVRTKIFVYSTDVRSFYMGLYYTYPRILTQSDKFSSLSKIVLAKTYPYIATYNAIITSPMYTRVATCPDQSAQYTGRIYKRL